MWVKMSLLAGLLLGGCGCGARFYPSSGVSLCPADKSPALVEAINRASGWWNALGLKLDDACQPGAHKVLITPTVTAIAEPIISYTQLFAPDCGPACDPQINVDPVIEQWAESDDPMLREKAAGTIAHEWGHAMGLVHVADETSVMYYAMHPLTEPPSETDVTLAHQLTVSQ